MESKNKATVFHHLRVGSFFASSGIECMSCSIFVKVSDTDAVCVWDSMAQEARGRRVSLKPNLSIRETYTAFFVDEQTPISSWQKNDAGEMRKNIFRVSTANGSYGLSKQILAFGNMLGEWDISIAPAKKT
jgi:hypothetical protein